MDIDLSIDHFKNKLLLINRKLNEIKWKMENFEMMAMNEKEINVGDCYKLLKKIKMRCSSLQGELEQLKIAQKEKHDAFETILTKLHKQETFVRDQIVGDSGSY